jgi:hypothetical protein
MRRIIACSVFVIALVGGLQISGLPWWGLACGLCIVGAMAWRLSICPHDGPLALLPATTALDGSPLPPRWHCDACGQTWAANFAKERTPVRRFTGYDESKAVNAARRAAELADRQRALALRRAGLRPASTSAELRGAGAKRGRSARRTEVALDTADIVPIGQGRRLVG